MRYPKSYLVYGNLMLMKVTVPVAHFLLEVAKLLSLLLEGL